MDKAAFKVGIVTALPKEYATVRCMFDHIQDWFEENDPNDYAIGTIQGRGNKNLYVPITLLKKMGNNSAAAASRDMLRSFTSITDLIMVGIAGGIPHPTKPGAHVRLGDIVVSDKEGVVQFDNIKLSNGHPEIRNTSSPPSATLTGKVRLLEADRLAGHRPWEQHIKRTAHIEHTARPSARKDVLLDANDPPKRLVHPDQKPERRPEVPMIHYGLIGSSNTLMKDAQARDALRDQSAVLAIEMEGSGIADGTWTSGAKYLLVRGICDYADQAKNDSWQGYAAAAAASYVRALMDKLIDDPAFAKDTKKK